MDAKIVCHGVLPLGKIWAQPKVYMLDILSISSSNVILPTVAGVGRIGVLPQKDMFLYSS